MQEKSKNLFENSTTGTIGARIKVLLEETGKSVTELEEFAKIGNGTLKTWKDRSLEFSSNVLSSFKRKLDINEEWWKTGEGEVFNTYVEIPKENSMEVGRELKQLIEQNDKYSLVPNIILTQYEIQSKEEILRNQEVLKKALEYAEQLSKAKDVVIQAKNDLISELKKENAELLAATIKAAVPAQQAQ